MLSSILFLVVNIMKVALRLDHLQKNIVSFIIQYYSTILHMGVNDILNKKSPSSTDNLVSNLVKIDNKCISFGVMDLFVSGIAFIKRLPYAVIKNVNEKIVGMCKKNGMVFVDNGNISNIDFYTEMAYTY